MYSDIAMCDTIILLESKAIELNIARNVNMQSCTKKDGSKGSATSTTLTKFNKGPVRNCNGASSSMQSSGTTNTRICMHACGLYPSS